VDTGGGLYYPVVTGTAVAGATITVAAGGTSATTTADAAGAWSASAYDAEPSQVAASADAQPPAAETAEPSRPSDQSDQSGQSDLGVLAPPVTAPPVAVSGTIEVTQTVAGVQSEPASAPYSITGPQLSVEQLLWVESPIVAVHVAGTTGAHCQIVIDGVPTGQPLSAGETQYLLLASWGEHTIAARYDDGSGRFGPSAQVTITVDLPRPGA